MARAAGTRDDTALRARWCKPSCCIILICLLFMVQPADAGLPDDYQDYPAEKKIETLIEYLSGDISGRWKFVIYELRQEGDVVLPVLHTLLDRFEKSGAVEPTRAVVVALAYFPSERSVGRLAAVHEEYPGLDREVVFALGAIDRAIAQDSAYRCLVTLFMRTPQQEVLMAAVILEPAPVRIPVLLDALRGQENMEAVMRSLARRKDRDALIALMVQRLQSRDARDRAGAVSFLSEVPTPASVAALRGALDAEPAGPLQLRIVVSLVRMGDFGSLAYFISMLKDKFPDRRELAREWLVELTGKDFGEDPAAWQRWFDAEMKKRGT